MNLKPLIILAVVVSLAGFIFWDTQRQTITISTPSITTQVPNTNCTPTFVDGGGPYYKPDSPFRENIAPNENTGQKLIVTGKVLRQDCATPLAGTTLDIWQANESGSYEDEWYRGQITTKEDGSYRFETVVPLGYGEGTGYRPPHIHFKVFDGSREVITSQMFLPEAREQGIDEAYIVKLERDQTIGVLNAYHDIVVPE